MNLAGNSWIDERRGQGGGGAAERWELCCAPREGGQGEEAEGVSVAHALRLLRVMHHIWVLASGRSGSCIVALVLCLATCHVSLVVLLTLS